IYTSADDLPANGGVGGYGLYENNIIDGARAGGLVIHFDGNDNGIYRNNIISNFGLQSPWPPPPNWPYPQNGGGITLGGAGGGDGTSGLLGPQNNQVYNNIIYNGAGNGGTCIWLWGENNNQVVNNTCHHMDVGVYVSHRVNTNTTVQNNIWSDVLQELTVE